MKGLRSIVPLRKESMRGVEPRVRGTPPAIEWVKPTDIFVEESYQRDLEADGSTTLIRKIAGDFDWSRYKLPICCRLPEFDGALVAIDGQHTATAAACVAAARAGIDVIPVAVISAAEVADRAKSFVGHNRDRLALTQQAIYRAELAAGDDVALAVDRACRAAGATVLRNPPGRASNVEVGATVATGSMRKIARLHGGATLERVLSILVRAARAPLSALEINAVVRIIARADRPGLDSDLVKVVGSTDAMKWKSIAMADAARSGDEIGEALTGAWCRALDVRLAAATKKITGPEPAKPPQEPAPRKPAPRKPAAPERSSFIPPIPPIAPIPPMPPLSFEEPPVKVSRTVSNGGVSIDLETGTVAREKRAVRLPLDQAAFAAALLRVMPAQLPADRIAPKVWGGPTGSPRSRLKTLMDEANFGLAAVRLKIRAFDAFFAISDL